MKGSIQPDHIPANKYRLIVVGMPPLLFTEISGIEDEVETTDLPDRTVASSGTKKAVEFTAMAPAHHGAQRAAMELWYKGAQDPIAPDYKKQATLVQESGTGRIVMRHELSGLFVHKRKLPDMKMEDEGTMSSIEYTFKADNIEPI